MLNRRIFKGKGGTVTPAVPLKRQNSVGGRRIHIKVAPIPEDGSPECTHFIYDNASEGKQ